MSDSGKSKGNLARIRDNQRRSRARRKEYLQELEQKYRQCEQIGIEASAEIQAAARRVLEENKRLRAFIKSRGFTENDLDAFSDEVDRPADPTAGVNLEFAMQPRKPPRQQTMDTPRSGWNTPQPQLQQAPSSVPIQPFVSQRSIAIQRQIDRGSASPLSMVSSSCPTPPSISTPTFSHVPMNSDVQIPDIEAYRHQVAMGTSYPTDTASEVDSYTPTSYYSPQPGHLQDFGSPWPPAPASDPGFMPEDPVYGNTSCVSAANIIRNMRYDVGNELEQDLGCRNAGENCEVPNRVVFDVMDRYSSHPPQMSMQQSYSPHHQVLLRA